MNREPIHPWRWRAITLWIIIFTALVFWAVHQNRSTITQLRDSKASITSLERTNCGLRQFLLAAKLARVSAERHDPPHLRQADRIAAAQYGALVRNFTKDNCAQLLPPRRP